MFVHVQVTHHLEPRQAQVSLYHPVLSLLRLWDIHLLRRQLQLMEQVRRSEKDLPLVRVPYQDLLQDLCFQGRRFHLHHQRQEKWKAHKALIRDSQNVFVPLRLLVDHRLVQQQRQLFQV